MWRNLMFFLVLANLMVWAWQRWIVPPDAADALALQASRAPELVLLSPGSAGAGAGVVDTCLRVGPFASGPDAQQGAATLKTRGLGVSVESESVEIWLGHWVQVPDLADRAAANSAREDLVAVGLGDAYVVRTDSGFKISLGVFRDKDRADRVAGMARGAGFTPVTADRTRDGEEYWLLVGPMEGAGLDLAGLEATGDRILRSEVVACPGTAADSEPRPDSLESAAAAAPTPE